MSKLQEIFQAQFIFYSQKALQCDKISCALCGFKTIHDWSIRVHRKMHLTHPHLCRVGDCRKCFKSEELLIEHQKDHLGQVDGFQCDHCDKKFTKQFPRTRHVIRIHQNVKRRSTIHHRLLPQVVLLLPRHQRRVGVLHSSRHHLQPRHHPYCPGQVLVSVKESIHLFEGSILSWSLHAICSNQQTDYDHLLVRHHTASQV